MAYLPYPSRQPKHEGDTILVETLTITKQFTVYVAKPILRPEQGLEWCESWSHHHRHDVTNIELSRKETDLTE